MWINCSNQNQGNVVSWQNSSQTIELKGLQQVNDSASKICPNEISNHFVGKEHLTFFETFKYCSKFGDIVEMSSYEKVNELNKTLKIFSRIPFVFTGFTDIKVEGEWVLHNTDKKLQWDNWNPGEPNSYEGNEEDCAGMLKSDLKFYDIPCSVHLVPVCKVDQVKQI